MPVLDLIPVQFSHRVIMGCIEEIKLRGLRHPHLFRNAFHVPSVEAALAALANPHKSHLFSVKMMRIDTVAGLLTTALSRTYPPLIPPHIQEMFQNPNGRFFFELLGMLPELNRYLFVEILDLCCAIVDQQAYNQISHSKLAVFPGSCCFGRNEYKPNWDTRYLMTADMRKFSGAFYHAIYAYRDERDLTEDELQHKLDTRARILEQERIVALERQHGYKGAQAILRMEDRIAQGLPAESPNVMKEVSLYADRKEKVVADDAISILDIQLDDDEDGVSRVPNLDLVVEEPEPEEEEIENVQLVLRDLRRSVSVASLGSSRFENQPRPSISSVCSSNVNVMTSPVIQANGYLSPTSPSSPRSLVSVTSLLSRSNTIARSVSLKFHPVSPGDIFGISQRAVEKRELEGFLAVARSVKTRKTRSRKRSLQQRQLRKMQALTPASDVAPAKSSRIIRRGHRTLHPHSTIASSVHSSVTAADLRRKRAKKFRKELEVYQVQGLLWEEAIEARETDLKKQKRRERRAKKAALAKADAEREVAAAAAVADAIALHGLGSTEDAELTMEEAEILEAFDYLCDAEFAEFMELAGLTPEDVENIRAKAAALSLSKVTQDIQSIDASTNANPEIERVIQVLESVVTQSEDDEEAPIPEIKQSFDDAEDLVDPAHLQNAPSDARTQSHASSLRHMTSMDMLFKHASVIGDANLRLYPTRPSSPTISDYESDSMHGGLLSRAASVMRHRAVDGGDDTGDDRDFEDEETPCVPAIRHSIATSIPYTAKPTLATKTAPYSMAPILSPRMEDQQDMVFTAPQQQMNNHQHRVEVQAAKQQAALMQAPTSNAFEFEMVEDYVIDEEDEEVLQMQIKVETSAAVEETEEEAELRELLESMSEEERSEFLRLSNQEDMPSSMAQRVLVQH
ncbi:hypothetical protein BG011_004605 [Mortierella polycephala]|uniref:Rho-GAP domain-containing protein n=1 Tax=Mortierella polycephala TaxID=41804 RepID=A0A9P6U246_9FUNG|nr:hypothetical protein BG011_004605 [Mortierella polycephala]